MKKGTKILTIVFFIGSALLAFFLYWGVQATIDERESITVKERQIIEHLRLIREAEINFRNVYGSYTDNWDSLITFIQSGQVPILQRREEIIMKEYGGEEVKIYIDTLGYISAKEQIFTKKHALSATDDGIFKSYRVQEGDRVLRNQKAYTISINGKNQSPPFPEQGTITYLTPLNEGDSIKKGQTIIQYMDYQFDPDIDLSKLGEIPYMLGKKFNIFVGQVDRNGVLVNVIEVSDPAPVNPKRSENNDAKIHKPLRFGSRYDVSISGNWE